MGAFFAYSIQSSVCLALFYLFYKVLLSRETFHRFNRAGLLGILILSLIVPCTLSLFPLHQETTSILDSDIRILISDISFSGNTLSDDMINEKGNVFLSFLLIVYLTGCLLFLLYAILSAIRIGYLIKRGTNSVIGNGTKLILLDDLAVSPFSWMKYIVLSKSDHETAGEAIITHESAHINLRHSYDLLIAQLCIITQWFNPAAWLLYRELQHIHEYEADDAVIRKGINVKQYQLLLIKKAVGTRRFSMANSLNHSNLKKRITMMYQKKSNPWARLKYAYVLPLAAITVALFARPEVSQPFEEISNAKISHFTSETNQNEVKNLPEAGISEIPSVENTLLSLLTPTVSLEIGSESHEIEAFLMDVLRLRIRSSIVLEKDMLLQTPDDSIYSHVEKFPAFPGGDAKLVKWLQDNLRYPRIAMENGIIGVVYCQFVVEKDGSLTDFTVVRGPNQDLNQEAIRVLKMLPKFTPGTQGGEAVRFRFTLPVAFKLDKGRSENSQPDEVDVVAIPISDSPFSFYPNPANDILYISVDQPAMIEKYRAAGKAVSNLSYDIRLYNTSGTMALQTTSGSSRIQLSISNIPDGIYFLHLYDGIDNAPEVKQVIIKH